MLAQPVVGLVRPAAGESSARAPRQGTRVGTKGSHACSASGRDLRCGRQRDTGGTTAGRRAPARLWNERARQREDAPLPTPARFDGEVCWVWVRAPQIAFRRNQCRPPTRFRRFLHSSEFALTVSCMRNGARCFSSLINLSATSDVAA